MFTFSLLDKDLDIADLFDVKLKKIINPQYKKQITYKYNIYKKTKIFIKISDETLPSNIIQKSDVVNKTTAIQILKNDKYLVLANTNQHTYLLLFTKFNDINTCLLIDKVNNEFYVIDHIYSKYDELYCDTMFEGELLSGRFKNDKTQPIRMFYVISDITFYHGKDIRNDNLYNRINYIKMSNININDIKSPYPILIKDYKNYNELEDWITNILPHCEYNNKIGGLIFRSVQTNDNYLLKFSLGCSDFSVKIDKPKIDTNKHKVVCFKLISTATFDNFKLFLKTKDNDEIQYDYALVNDFKTSIFLQNIYNKMKMTENHSICVKCIYVNAFDKWKPIEISDNNEPDIYDDIKI